MRFTKLTATGNDFVVVDLLDDADLARALARQSRPDWARQVCDRHEGIGADGFIVLEPDAHLDFRWDFYNSDGGSAEMCGNAARAVALYVSRRVNRPRLTFRTLSGEVSARVESSGLIEVTLAAIVEADVRDGYHFVRAGVPHAVVRVDDLSDRAALRTRALAIKAAPEFRAAGTNVTFLREKSPSRIESVTFERGVEDFTLSCGTGAVAAAFARGGGAEGVRTEVRVPGGELAVVWTSGRPVLAGPARIVARVEWLDDRTL